MAFFEWIGFSGAYNIIKDVRQALGKRHEKTAAEHFEAQNKWRPVVEGLVRDTFKNDLRSDCIIRDVRRRKQYPTAASGKGISAWFRAGLVGTYHAGIEVALSIHSLVWQASEDSWRLLGLDEESEGALNAYLIGYIPWENVQHIDPEGDEYYSYPHIFCRFQPHGQPYEKLAFCERKQLFPTSLPYFKEVEAIERVKLTSQKFGTASMMWTR